MGVEAWLSISTVVACFGCLVFSRIPADIVLIAGVAVLMFLGIVTPQEALSGLSNEGMATVAVLFVVARALSLSGVVSWLSQALLGRPRHLSGAQLRLMLPVAGLSSILNNTPVVAMLVPAVSEWSRRIKLPVSQLMMPLSYAAIIGGTCTLIGTSTNLVINGMLIEVNPNSGLGMFDLAWVGVPCVMAVVIYTLFFSRFLLPFKTTTHDKFGDVRQYIIEMVVVEGSPVAGLSIEDAGLRNLPGVYLVEINRDNRLLTVVSPREILRHGDRLIFAGDVDSVVELKNIHGLELSEDQLFKLDSSGDERCLVEVVISPNFPNLNLSVQEGKFRTHYGAVIIAISRDGEHLKRRIGDVHLKPGDTLLLEAHEEFLEQQRYARDFLLVSQIENSKPIQHHRRGTAIMILVAMVAAVSFGWLSMFQAALLASGGMLVTRCISVQEARSSIDWQILLVVAASIGLGGALDKTGAATGIAEIMVASTALSPIAALATIFFLTAAFSALISNLAAAVLMFPIMLATCESLSVDIVPFAVTLMIAASASFSSPIGYQTNLMVYGPGDYRFTDFIKMGVPLTLVVGLITITIVPLVWSF
tara:strand:+ start:341 stop:2110 length:1770 start_codon:yes stop_codon:yes gene_type:complete